MKRIGIIITGMIIAVVAVTLSCQQEKDGIPEFEAPLMENLGTYKFEITTESEWAQKFFNQGMMWAYGFNHAEAARAFKEAIKQDPECAMCHWGVAYVLGPNYNAGMDESVVEEAYNAAQMATKLAPKATDWEQALIKAIAARNAEKTLEREHLDQAYSDAMKEAHQKFPDHAETATLYAESIMDLHPWDLWTKETLEPQPWTPEIVGLLEQTIKKFPDQPGANHLYIHAVEASSTPQIGLESASKLETLIPGSGHLVHMPSHIYIRTGNYHQGSVVNQIAIGADSSYIATCNAQGMYPMAYFPHNIHFLAATAALEGRGELSLQAAIRVADEVDNELMAEPGYGILQHFNLIPWWILVKFGQWDHILQRPAPSQDLPYQQAIWNYARGMALANTGAMDQAHESLAKLTEIAKDSSLMEVTIFDINVSFDVVQVAKNVLAGEIAFQEKDYDRAIALLRKAVELEGQLNYTEPPDWFFSVRHRLGNVLVKAGKFEEAEGIYKEDLKTFPENGWALNGLYESLMAQSKDEEAQTIKTRFDEAWQWADTPLAGSMVDLDRVVKYQDISPIGAYSFDQQLALAFCRPLKTN